MELSKLNKEQKKEPRIVFKKNNITLLKNDGIIFYNVVHVT